MSSAAALFHARERHLRRPGPAPGARGRHRRPRLHDPVRHPGPGRSPRSSSGRDIVGVAQTGTGKTAAFGLPLLAAIDPDVPAVQAIVLTPTRELAMQVADAIQSFATHLPGLNVLAVYGGSPFLPQQRALARGAQVVVGTPGRVLDHLERRTLKLDDVRFLVLDEADEMLRMGFAEDVDKVLRAAPDASVRSPCSPRRCRRRSAASPSST